MNKYDGIKKAAVTVTESPVISKQAPSLTHRKGLSFGCYIKGLIVRIIAASVFVATVFAYKYFLPSSGIISGIKEAVTYESESTEDLKEAFAGLLG